MHFLRLRSAALAVLLAASASPAAASFHAMQIEQVIGGVDGDVTVQAIQLRQRQNSQNFVGGSRLRVWDAAGNNPIVVSDPTSTVPNGATGDRILIATANFASHTSPPAVVDFTMTSVIPASYLAAGSLTFENNTGTLVYWRLSWGGAGYTGSNFGTTTNDPDGDFGPPYDPALPSGGLNAVRFTGPATAPSSGNVFDYANSDPGVFTNNAGNSFTVTPPPQVVVYHGLDNTALGQAQLTPTPKAAPPGVTDHQLIVSNIGSSGLDGVSIDLGGADGGLVQWQPLPPPGNLPDGTALRVETTGLVGGSEQPIGFVSATDAGTTVQLDADLSGIGSSTQRIEIYAAGQLAHVIEGHTGPLTAQDMPNGCDKGDERIPNPLPPFPPTFPGPWNPFPCFIWFWDQPTSIDIPLVGAVTGDEVRVLAESVIPDLQGIVVLALTMTNTGPTPTDFTIIDEALGIFGRNQRGLGQVAVGPAPAALCNDCLVISNIGASGDDGVEMELDPLDIGLRTSWQPIDPGNPPPSGAVLDLSATAVVGGNPGQPLGNVRLNSDGAQFTILPDYSPIGSSTQLLEFLDDGQIVQVISGHSGPLTVPEWPGGCGKEFVPFPPILCFVWDWDTNVPITIPGGPTISADELRILSENPSFTYDSLDRLILRAAVLPNNELVIVREANAVSGEPAAGWQAAAALGNSHVGTTAGHDHLTISNIGSSGEDGVSIDLDDLDLFRTDWCPLGTDASYPGGFFEVTAIGQLVGDQAPHPLGSVRAENGAQLELSTNYAPIGATQVRVIVRDNNVTVASFVVGDGLIATLPNWPRGCGKEPTNLPGGGPETLCFWIDPGDDVPVDFPGAPKAAGLSTVINADLIQLLAEDPSAPLDFLSAWDMRLANIPSMLFDNVAAEHPTDAQLVAPRRTVLYPSVPNPFNPRTTLAFDVPRTGRVQIQVFSPAGRLVRTLYDGTLLAGRRTMVWNGRDSRGRQLASGTYLVRLVASGSTASQKVTLVK